MEELDPFCLTRHQELHGVHIHQHHFFEIESHSASVPVHLGFDLGHVLRADTTDEVVHRCPAIARRFNPERHRLVSRCWRRKGKPRAQANLLEGSHLTVRDDAAFSENAELSSFARRVRR
jgi:hypothetical protein